MNTSMTRSTFVTVVAWIFIIMSGFAVLISVLQNIMFQFVFNSPQFEQALHNSPPAAPKFALFMFSHFRIFILVFLIVAAISLISSIGLLKRKNWARLFFIALMIIGIIWNLAGVVLQFFTVSYMHGQFNGLENAPPDMNSFMNVMVIFTIIIALGFSILFGWIVKKLLSSSIRAEFT